jgi:hypothetical protein
MNDKNKDDWMLKSIDLRFKKGYSFEENPDFKNKSFNFRINCI